MYFGTIDGIVEFNPAALTASNKTIATPLQLTAISKLDVGADTLISCMDEFASMGKIVLQTHEKSLTLQFALLDFSFSRHHYAYMIEGLDNDWSYISENYVRLNGLPYGTYGIRIKAQQADGTWNENELLIPVTVIAPLYARVWFYPIVIFALAILFYAFMRLRTRKLMRDKTKLENIVKKRTATLNNALNDKDVLLKEIHHRVKNNLQVIAGLLQLQKVSLHDEHAITAINESQMRVNSIALIHQNMYQQENLEEIDFQHFLHDLFKNLKSLYEQEQKQLTFDLNAEGIALDIDTAVPLGLITNELLTNTYKHAFAHSTHVTAKLTLRKLNANEYELTYSDSGPGIPVDYNIEQSESLGMQLLQGLSQQLMGTLRYHSGVNHYFSIVFKNAEARKRS
jgi:two-component sensor histidine kinase